MVVIKRTGEQISILAQQLMGVHKVSAFHPFIFQKSEKSTIIRNVAVPRHVSLEEQIWLTECIYLADYFKFRKKKKKQNEMSFLITW
jgi:hypothetical protein